ncbi:MAG TPA: tetratricopeptide repeat protein [Blastocatellia bacterium]|nr:tetratricopeptide repeat protein [Blastocatellia bacterium]
MTKYRQSWLAEAAPEKSSMINEINYIYEFGPYQLDAAERLLLREGKPVQLTPKSFETLHVLVQNSGRVLDKGILMQRVWPDSFVEEATLAQNIFTLRKILGETPEACQYIETVPRRGYRFAAKVNVVGGRTRQQSATEAAAPGPALRSIAVLPFKSLSLDISDEYFGLGMADALITMLSNLRSIIVRPTSAVLKYNNLSQETLGVGRDLKVDLVLEGKMQQVGERIRVTVQLLKVDSGLPLWAEKFDCQFMDLFALQDFISSQIAEALTLQLSKDESELLTKHSATNPVAYQEYLKGRYQWNKWTQESFEKSIKHFERAIEIEPDFALAYTGIADAHNALQFYGYRPPHLTMPQMKAASNKALEIDDTLAEAHLSLATTFMFYDWDWAGAEREFKRAIELNPTYAMAYHGFGIFLTAMGRFDEAEAKLKRALELDPVSPLISTTVGFPYYFSGQFDKAVEQYERTLEVEPNFVLIHTSLGDAYLQMGMNEKAIAAFKAAIGVGSRKPGLLSSLGHALAISGEREEANRILEELLEESSRQYVSPMTVAMVYLGLGEKDKTFALLQSGYYERSNRMVFLKVQPCFFPLHSDARFTEMLRCVGLI